MKFKIKSKKLDEITDSDLGDVKRILAGNQMPALFGNAQRFVVDVEKPKNIDDVVRETHSSLLEYKVTQEMLDSFKKYLDKRAANFEGIKRFKIDVQNGFLVRNDFRAIPSGPRKGEYIGKDRNFSLSSFNELVDATDKLMQLRDELEDFTDKNSEFYNDVTTDYKKSLERVKGLTDRFWSIFQEIKDPDKSNWIYADDFPTDTDDEKTNSINMVILYMTDLLEHLKAAAVAYKGRHNARNFSDTPISLFKTTLEKVVETSKGRKIIFSRAPIDLARMSDFSQSGIDSCHSPGSSKFHCALFDASNNGAIAFLVPEDAYEKTADKLQARDYFKDMQRSIEGPVPIKRIRIRRFYYIPGEFEIGIPELKVYGGGGDEDQFKEQVKKVLKERQQTEYDGIINTPNSYTTSNFIFVGGSWSDDTPEQLLYHFFGNYVKRTDGGKVPKASEDTLQSGQYYALEDLIKISNISVEAQDALKDETEYEASGYTTDYDEFTLTTNVPTLDSVHLTDPDLLEKFVKNVPDSTDQARRIVTAYINANASYFDTNNHIIQYLELNQYFLKIKVITVLRYPNPNVFTRDILKKIVKHFKICEELGDFRDRSEFSKYFEKEANKLLASASQQTTQLEVLNRNKKITGLYNIQRNQK
jgi:hypothetical protein